MSNDKDSELLKLAQMELLTATNQWRQIEGLPPLEKLPEPPFCSFCGRSKVEVGKLVEGHEAHICPSCAAEAHRMLLKE